MDKINKMDNKIKIGKRYLINIKSANTVLSYTSTVLSYDDKYICVLDKFQKTLIFPIFNLISLEEIPE